MQKPIIILAAPSTLGSPPSALSTMPDALLSVGVKELIKASEIERIPLPAHVQELPGSPLFNQKALHEYTKTLAASLEHILDKQQFPVVLGGDATVTMAAMLALKKHGTYGLMYISGKDDLRLPNEGEQIYAADAVISLLAGYGPDDIVDLHGRKPYVHKKAVAVYGVKDTRRDENLIELEPFSDQLVTELGELKIFGAYEALRTVYGAMVVDNIEGIWVHVDLSVLHPTVLGKSPDDGDDGLNPEELVTSLRWLFHTGKIVGLDVTGFNPAEDKTGDGVRVIASCLGAAFLDN